MTWFKLDDQFPRHPKVMRAGSDAAWLFVAGGCYCAQYLTDGMIPKDAVAGLTALRQPVKLAQRLVEVGLWHDRGDEFEVHDYLVYNPSRQYVETEREWAKQRNALNRDPELTKAIRTRDGDRCRYCGQKVNFKDRRSAAGGTYDHVIPRGPNTLDNIVTACRRCNMQKGAREPDDAGLILLAPGQFGPSSEPDQNQTPVPVPAVPSEQSFAREFDDWWSGYPRKLDKSQAKKAYQSRRRQGITPDALVKARDNYLAAQLAAGIDPEFLKYAGSFLSGADGSWSEWLETPEPATIDFDPAPPKVNGKRCELCEDTGGILELDDGPNGERRAVPCDHRVPV